jgi:hypothetical protein
MSSGIEHPLLRQLLSEKNLSPRGIYNNKDAAAIFAVTVRTIQAWTASGKLPVRDLPGGGRFLACDLETFLANSIKAPAEGAR